MKNNGHKRQLLLDRCLKDIEEKMKWPAAEDWQSAHYELLSEKIWEETRIHLSPVTLKRLWGKVSYDSSPSRSTLDALAVFIGYDNWISYQLVHEAPLKPSGKNRKSTVFFPSFRLLKKYVFVLGIALIVSVVLITILSNLGEKLEHGPVDFDFELVTMGLPNTVNFNYDVTGSAADSVFIQQSWNPKLRHKVAKNRKFFASTYYYPGFYRAKLILDNTIVREKDLHILSNGWLGTINRNKIPLYITGEAMSKPSGELGITAEDLIERGVDLKKELPRVKLHLIKDFGEVSDEDLKLVTVFRNSWAEGDGVCQNTEILLLGSEAPLIIPFSIIGCVGELNMYLAGESIQGQATNLSGFGVDFSDWVRLELTLVDKKLAIKVNDTLVFEKPLNYPMGKLVGIRYLFYGTGSVQSLHIGSESGTKFRFPE